MRIHSIVLQGTFITKMLRSEMRAPLSPVEVKALPDVKKDKLRAIHAELEAPRGPPIMKVC